MCGPTVSPEIQTSVFESPHSGGTIQKIRFDQKVIDKHEMKHSKTFPQKFFAFVDAEGFQTCNLDCVQKWKALQDLNATHVYSNQKTLDHNQLKTWHKRWKSPKTKTKTDIDS